MLLQKIKKKLVIIITKIILINMYFNAIITFEFFLLPQAWSSRQLAVVG